MILTETDIETLTGYKRPKQQRRSLSQSGIRFVVRADGRPITTWEAVNAVLAKTAAAPVGPDLSWMQ